MLFLPALVVSSKTFEVRDGYALGSRAVFWRALLVTALIVVPSLIGTLWVVGEVARRVMPILR